MKETARDCGIIALVVGAVYFIQLGATGLWDMDEPLYASISREMFERGDWVVPYYNGEMFDEKPVLMFWQQIAGFVLLGKSELGARFFSPVLGVATALAVYGLGRFLFRREVGLWAALIGATTLGMTISARAATADIGLTFVSLLALAGFVGAERQFFDAAGEASSRWRRTGFYAVFWAGCALALLSKGPIGLLLPAATAGLFLLIQGAAPVAPPVDASRRAQIVWNLRRMAAVFSPRNFLAAIWRMRPLTALVVLLAVAGPWHFLVGLRTDGEWLRGFVWDHNIAPFFKPSMGHKGPFFMQFVFILVFFFPWSVFFGPQLFHWVRKIRQGDPHAAAYVFLACWAGVWFVFWSKCSTKLPHYTLPAYPALAMAMAAFLAEWCDRPAEARRWWWRNAAITLVAVGCGIGAAMPFVARIYAPGEEIVALAGLPLVVGGAAFGLYLRRGAPRAGFAAFTATSAAFLLAIFAFAAERIDRHQHARPLVEEIRRECPDPQLAGYRYNDALKNASTVYYAGERVAPLEKPEELRQFLAASPHPYVFVTSKDADEVRRAAGGQLREAARRPQFLKKGDVIVLTR